MNFHIEGTRSITISKTGVVQTQTCEYETWQTPTKVTDEILASMLPVEAYKAWVMSISKDTQESVYAQGDLFEEGEPIGTNTVNFGSDECLRVDEWIADAVSNGFELEFYSM